MKGTLKTRRQFRRVYDQGTKAVGRHVVAFALCDAEPGPALSSREPRGPLVGYVASRKIGGSVRRNRAKRVLRASFQPLRARVRPSTWLVLVARLPVTSPEVRSPEVQAELEQLLAGLGVLNGSEDTPPSERGPTW